MENQERTTGIVPKPLYKRWWLWGIAAVVLAVISGIVIYQMVMCSRTSDKDMGTIESSESTVLYLHRRAEEKVILSSPKPTEPPTTTRTTHDPLCDKDDCGDDEIDDEIDCVYDWDENYYSIIRATSAEVTYENLRIWYFNYVARRGYRWCMIVYTDKSDHSGVYAVPGLIKKDVIFEEAPITSGCEYVRDPDGNMILFHETDHTVEYRPADEERLVSSVDFVKKVKVALQNAAVSGVTVTDVALSENDLRIYADIDPQDAEPDKCEKAAFAATTALTKPVLQLKDYDALWDTVTVDFGKIGYVTNDKDNISIEDYAIWWEITKAEGENENNPLRRYFIPNNFKLQSHS